MNTTMLLDTDIPIYEVASMSQSMEPSWTGGDDELVLQDFDKTCRTLDAVIRKLAKAVEADSIIICLSEPSREKNWRRAVLPTYKSKRNDTVSPEYRQALTDYAEQNYDSYLKPTLEGDDVLGILATNPKVIRGRKIIVSGDKDMQTIPSRTTPAGDNLLYNPDKDSFPYWNEDWMADWYWMYQTLIGDSTDGYGGLKGCGPGCAIGKLGMPKPPNTLDVMWPKVVKLYQTKGFTEEDAIVQAQVARIARTEDFNYKTKRVIPWLPTGL